MKRYLVASLAVLVLALGAQLSAHHSFAATYLEDQSVTIEGQIVQFLLRNPHSFVHVMVKEKDGTTNRYVVEWGSPSQLRARYRETPSSPATKSSSPATPAATRPTTACDCSRSSVRRTAGAGAFSKTNVSTNPSSRSFLPGGS